MKTKLILAAVAVACGTAFAQAPPRQQQDPDMPSGKAQAKGEMNAQAKGSKDGTLGVTKAGTPAMDLNGDGMITRKEWDAYHGTRWSRFRANKQGMVPWADVQAGMKEAP